MVFCYGTTGPPGPFAALQMIPLAQTNYGAMVGLPLPQLIPRIAPYSPLLFIEP